MCATSARNCWRPWSSRPSSASGGSAAEESIRSDLRQFDAHRRRHAAVLDAARERLEFRQRGQRVGAVRFFVRDDVDEADAIVALEGGVTQAWRPRSMERLEDSA